MKLLAIAIGGAAGALARHSVSLLVTMHARGFPWPTFLVNVTGSFVAGVLAAALGSRSEILSAGLLIGFLGAYTTFSAFAVQTQALLADDAGATAVIYTLTSVLIGVAAAWCGVLLGRNV